jgi:hypothetical protein
MCPGKYVLIIQEGLLHAAILDKKISRHEKETRKIKTDHDWLCELIIS